MKCISKQFEFHRSMVRNIFHKCKTFKIKLCNAQTLQPTDCINVARKRPWNIVAQLMIIKLQLNKAQDFGGNVLWTDETKVEMCGNNAQHHGWLKLNREHNIINTSHQLSNMIDPCCHWIHLEILCIPKYQSDCRVIEYCCYMAQAFE